MLAIPLSISTKANNTLATQPMLVAAIFAENGAADSLSTYYRMLGAKDIASGVDTNVAVLPETGEMTLSPGANVALLENTTPLPIGFSSEWRCVITDKYIGRYSVSIAKNDAGIRLRFTAQGTLTLDTLRIQLGQAAAPAVVSAVAVPYASFATNIAPQPLHNQQLATSCNLYIVDVLTGKQVGNSVSVNLPAGAPYLTRVFKGFAAGLVRSRVYELVILHTIPDTSALGFTYCVNANYYVRLVAGGFSIGSISSLWQIPILNGCIPLGGRTGYSAYGVAARSLDVCINGAVPPTTNGLFTYSDVLPAGTHLRVWLYATDDPMLNSVGGVYGWKNLGIMQSGSAIPAYRYWRAVIELSGTAYMDDTPRLASLSVSYMNNPVLLGTHAQRIAFPGMFNIYDGQTVKAINSVSSTSAALEPKAKTVMVGKITLELAPEPEVERLFSHPLRGKRVLIRAGYADVPDTLIYYDGLVRDLAYQGGRYILTIQDPIELADISVPRTRWPAWMAATVYASGTTVSHIDKSYLSLTAQIGTQLNQGLAPDLNPAFWQPAGNVWKDIGYLNNTHLCDAAADILQNQINLASEKIDLASLDLIKARYPTRVTTGRNIGNPEKAIDILSDLAWLLESFWVMREGRLALLPEASTDAMFVDFISPDDIKEGLQYRRGWAELKNECVIFTNYLGAGSGSEQFLNAVVVADAQSVADYGMAAVQEFKDKWNVPQAELGVIAGRFIQRWKAGRRIVRVDASMRLLAIECGDVVLLRSAQLPVGDMTLIKGIVMQKDLDWINQSIQLTLMEI